MANKIFNSLLGASTAFVPISLVASTAADAPDGVQATTPAINTSGATLLTVMVVYYTPGGTATLSDSKSNTWTPLTIYTASDGTGQLYYCKNPIVGSGHTFTLTDDGGGSDYNALAVAAFSGTNTAANADGDVGAGSASVTTQQPGSLTPSLDNGVVVTGLMFVDSSQVGDATINSGFTVTNSKSSAVGYSVALAYKIQTTAAAVNPTWTSPSAANTMIAAMTSFKHS